jgi:hypothetical protein
VRYRIDRDRYVRYRIDDNGQGSQSSAHHDLANVRPEQLDAGYSFQNRESATDGQQPQRGIASGLTTHFRD